MRQKLRQLIFSQSKWLSLVGVVILTLNLSSYSALAAILKGWRFDPRKNQLEFTIEQGTTPNHFLLQEPTRIVVDLPNTELGTDERQQNYSAGVVRQIRVSQFQEGVTRIVLEISPGIILSEQPVLLQQLVADPKANLWVLRPLISGTRTSRTSTAPTNSPPSRISTNSTRTTVRVPPLNSKESTNSPPSAPVNIPIQQTSSSERATSASQIKTPVIDFGQPLPKTTSSGKIQSKEIE
ncbi:MAG: AMIN domain-containing protein [Moorea sp. SIO2B7]|nr:AMIN domain-containing protein [Moorena sp. SIO2B7]